MVFDKHLRHIWQMFSNKIRSCSITEAAPLTLL